MTSLANADQQARAMEDVLANDIDTASLAHTPRANRPQTQGLRVLAPQGGPRPITGWPFRPP